MTGGFSAKDPTLTSFQLFEHIAVADLSADKFNAQLSQALFKRIVCHQGADDTLDFFPLHAIFDHHIQEFIAVIDMAARVSHDQAVRIAIQRNADITPSFENLFGQGFGVRGAHAIINVESIGSIAHRKHIRAQFVIDGRSHVIRRAVGAVDQNSQAFKIHIAVNCGLTKFNVATRSVFQTPGFAQFAAFHTRKAFIQFRFNFQLHFIGKLGAGFGEKFNSVVVIRIVTCTDDHTGIGSLSARQIGNGWRRNRTAQNHVNACAREACLKSGFKHVAGNTRVLANDYADMTARINMPSENTAGRLTKL